MQRSEKPTATVESVACSGEQCLRLTNGVVEVWLGVTFGPRIVHYGFVGGENVLGSVPEIAIETSLGTWRPRGGHRLWAAPEDMPRSYSPDNDPVEVRVGDRTVALTQQAEPVTGVQKVMVVTLPEGDARVIVEHRLVNAGPRVLEVAPWALTIMRAGGTALLPQEPYAPHPRALLPVRVMAMWAFTDLSDPRWTIGPRFIRLRNDVSLSSPQKVGIENRQGWAAYQRQGLLFVKRFDWRESARYPDRGVNTETFTAGALIELESLGALVELAPGDMAHHEERWALFGEVELPPDDDVLAAGLSPILTSIA